MYHQCQAQSGRDWKANRHVRGAWRTNGSKRRRCRHCLDENWNSTTFGASSYLGSCRECLSTITGQHSADRLGKQLRAVVEPEYLTDCVEQGKLLDCTPYVAVSGLVPPARVPRPSRLPQKGLGTKTAPIELSDSETFDAAALPRYCCQRQTPLVCKNSELIAQLAMIRQNRWLEGDDMRALAHSRAIAVSLVVILI